MDSTVRSTSRRGQQRLPAAGCSTFMIAGKGADLNHGNSSKGRKSSSSSTSIQNPCFEILVTSTVEVLRLVIIINRDNYRIESLDLGQILRSPRFAALVVIPAPRISCGINSSRAPEKLARLVRIKSAQVLPITDSTATT